MTLVCSSLILLNVNYFMCVGVSMCYLHTFEVLCSRVRAEKRSYFFYRCFLMVPGGMVTMAVV